ncbi:hypothetical protein CR513_60603, partial [Mucuna pruriens]
MWGLDMIDPIEPKASNRHIFILFFVKLMGPTYCEFKSYDGLFNKIKSYRQQEAWKRWLV